MLLGLVVHAELVLELTRHDFALRWLYEAIHVFRMPVFFVVGGYLASSLLARAGFRGFLLSRMKRVLAPLFAAEAVIALVLIPRGCSVCAGLGSSDWLNVGWLHLWFLAYLALIAHGFVLVAWLVARSGFLARLRVPRFRSGAFVLWAALAVLVSLCIPGYLNSDDTLRMSLGIVPDLPLLLLFSVFFGFGWLLERAGAEALNQWRQAGPALLVAGVVVYAWYVAAAGSWARVAYTVAMWALALGILGTSLWVFKKRNRVLDYLSHASYWVYLFHPAFLVLVAVAIRDWSMPSGVEFALLLIATFGLSVASYELLARRTIIGRFLSGRRRVRRLVPTEQRRAGGRWWLER
jgi:glucan biosynthesis protein C